MAAFVHTHHVHQKEPRTVTLIVESITIQNPENGPEEGARKKLANKLMMGELSHDRAVGLKSS
jgi:hypothetical protein